MPPAAETVQLASTGKASGCSGCGMQVDGLDARRARALYNADLRTPLAVLKADSTALKQALVKALPVGMQRHTGPHVKGGTLAAAQIGLGTDIGANQLLVRSVDSVTAMVGRHFSQICMENELDLDAAEVDAADLAAMYSSYSSQQAVPSPTQLSSQRPGSGKVASTQSHSHPHAQAAVASSVAANRSASSQYGQQFLHRPPHMEHSSHKSGSTPAEVQPQLQATQLHMPSAASRQGQRTCLSASQLHAFHATSGQQVPAAVPVLERNRAEHWRYEGLQHMQPNKVRRCAAAGDNTSPQASAPEIPASSWSHGHAVRPLVSQLRSQSAPANAKGPGQFDASMRCTSRPDMQTSTPSGLETQPGTSSTAHASGRFETCAAWPRVPQNQV